ncbi:MAG: phosphoenolpyruvate--protein phosphotransferase [Pyrinomonadaceae bacterium]
MKSTTELRIAARSVSKGVAHGKVVCLYGSHRQFYRVDIDERSVDKEVRRFRAAARLARRQLKNLRSSSAKSVGESLAGIFEVQLLILEDETLLKKIEECIREQKVNAEWAVKSVADSYIDEYKEIDDEYLRQRYIDIEDIRERLLAALGGGARQTRLEPGSILVSTELGPSTLIELAESRPGGIVTEHGGWTSHTFILARELNIPAVTGVRKLLRRVRTGDDVIVDGDGGSVVVRPVADTVERYRGLEGNGSAAPAPAAEAPRADGRLQTLDGREIVIRANADIPGLYQTAYRHGARGIGLYRSEYLFNRFRGLPEEAQQIAAYRKIAESAAPHGVRIRTFDLSADDLAEQSFVRQKNPSLGMRAIRLSLAREQDFRTQIRALLQAAEFGKIGITLPMVSDISEIRRARAAIAEESDNLRANGRAVGAVEIGAMVEVPAAVLMIGEILREVDFVSVGTNDLVQYILGVDRDNELVADSFRTLSPAVLRAVGQVVSAAAQHGKPAVVCGEMAGSQFYSPVLIGLGAVELSMNPTSVRRVRSLVSRIAYDDALRVTEEMLECSTASEAEAVLKRAVAELWHDLYPEGRLPA